MSVRVMTWVWQNGPTDPTERLILLALADHANDQGECYPSMAGIAAKASVTERGARGIMRRLEAGGWVSTKIGGGRGGKSNYRVLMVENPEPVFPVSEDKTRNSKPGIANPETQTRNVATVNPERDDTKPGTSVPPNHHRTIIEPSKSKSAPEKKARRTAIPETAVLSAKQIAIASEAGFTLEEAEAQFERFKGRAIAKGETYANWDHAWRNWFTSPYFKTITRNPHVSGLFKEPANGPAHRVDPALEQIARLAGLGQAPRNDCGGTGSHGEEVRPLRLGTRP